MIYKIQIQYFIVIIKTRYYYNQLTTKQTEVMNINTQISSKSTFLNGEVAFIGAGPGDAELLTIKALRFLEQADVIVYDRLVSREIIRLTPEDSHRIYVGKSLDKHCVTQDKINETLVHWAKKGKKVVRLKGGDSFIFGRGSEEINYLLSFNIASHIVPGITAASGCTSYAGIPLTHRDLAHSCSFITGHFSHNGELTLPWENYSNKTQTLVFYMGVRTSDVISSQLIKHGRDKATPVAIIHKGTQVDQQVWRTTLGELPLLVEEEGIKPPSLLVIGDVVNAIDEHQLNSNKQTAYFAPLEDITVANKLA